MGDVAMERVNAILLGLALVLPGTYTSAQADPEPWQLKRLLHPRPAELQAESRGRIMIYHGLTDTVVNRALDEQFDRIEAMMFTGTVVTDETGKPKRDAKTGKVVAEDDGC